MKIALLQINPTVGDLAGNAQLIAEAATSAARNGADLAVTPELALAGYLPRDLLLNAGFIHRCWEVVASLAKTLEHGPAVLVGLPEPNPSDEGRPLFNTAVLLKGGSIGQRFRKSLLPTYDVFDEDRYFEPFRGSEMLDFCNRRVGISICEDVWNDRDFWKRRRYHFDPIQELAQAGAQLIINLSASPFAVGKYKLRDQMLGSMAAKHRVPVLYVNQTGGNDDLLFDGRSSAFSATGQLIARGAGFTSDIVIVDVDAPRPVELSDVGPEAEIWDALVLGTRDYVRKCGFRSVVL
jgi:NAD+ synthase (glutamine-hydrolysing)